MYVRETIQSAIHGTLEGYQSGYRIVMSDMNIAQPFPLSNNSHITRQNASMHCSNYVQVREYTKLKGKHNVYSLVPKIPVSIYIMTKSEFISSCSQPAVGSNIVQITRTTLFVNLKKNCCRQPFWITKNHFPSHFLPFQIDTTIFILWILFTKWLPAAILDVWNSLVIAFLAISDRYGTSFFKFVCQNGRRRPFWISENHFWLHFWPFQIDTELFFFFEIFVKTATGGHFGCPKWPAAILDGTIMSFIELVRDIWMSNACVKFEGRSLNPSEVIALTTKIWRGSGCGRVGCVADENIIFPNIYVYIYIYIYMYI